MLFKAVFLHGPRYAEEQQMLPFVLLSSVPWALLWTDWQPSICVYSSLWQSFAVVHFIPTEIFLGKHSNHLVGTNVKNINTSLQGG